MKVVIQVVKKAAVKVEDQIVGQIDKGFVLFVGFTLLDNPQTVLKMVDKLLPLRLFKDHHGLTNLSLNDVQGQILSISQFTLYGEVKKGRRPSFTEAMPPQYSKELFDQFNHLLITKGVNLAQGIFGAEMEVSLVNDGPFTLILDSQELFGEEKL